jgi:hypothetical protein
MQEGVDTSDENRVLALEVGQKRGAGQRCIGGTEKGRMEGRRRMGVRDEKP